MLGHWSRSGNFLEQKVWWTDSKHRNSCKGRSRSGKTLYTLTSVYMFSILSSVNIFFGTDMKNLFKDQSFLRLVIISFVRMIFNVLLKTCSLFYWLYPFILFLITIFIFSVILTLDLCRASLKTTLCEVGSLSKDLIYYYYYYLNEWFSHIIVRRN